MAASVKSRRACGPSFVFLASARSCDALKSPRNDTGIDMTNLHRSPPMNQSETDLGIVNESQLLRFGMSPFKIRRRRLLGPPSCSVLIQISATHGLFVRKVMHRHELSS